MSATLTALLPFAPIVLEIMRGLPPAAYGPKPAELLEERERRYARIAISIDQASSRAVELKKWPGTQDELVGMLVTLGWWESRFAHHVHAGKCRPKLGECDPYKRADGTLIALAATPWQLQANGIIKPREWKRLTGTDYISTLRAAWAASRVISRARQACKGGSKTWPTRAIARYARGTGCGWRGAPKRARWFERTWRSRNVVVSAKTLELIRLEMPPRLLPKKESKK